MKKAYENWNQVIEYDGKYLVIFPSAGSESEFQNQAFVNHGDSSNPLEHQSYIEHLPAHDFSKQPPINPAFAASHMGMHSDFPHQLLECSVHPLLTY